jgi:RND family efflux transporter MFP subunit
MGATVTRHHQRVWAAGLFTLLSVGIVGCNREAPAAGGGEAPRVSVRHPEKRELTNHAEFNGWLQPDKIQEVRSRVRGHIKKVYFKDGDIVKKGDPLFEIDPRPFEATLAAAKAQVKSEEAQLELAKKEVARLTPLVGTGAASKQDFDVAVAKENVAGANKAKAQTSVDQANLDLEYAHITADLGGRISKAELTEGNLVNAGGSDPLLTTVVSTHPMRVYFNVDERSLQFYARSVKAEGKNVTELLASLSQKNSKPVEFTFALEGEKGFTHKGRLAFSDNRIDPSTGTIQLYGTVPNKDGFFVAGARVRVRLDVGNPYQALLVPETAILADQDQRYVLIVDDKNLVRRRNVTLGTLTDDGLRAIQPADKLEGGEKAEDWLVIVDNLQRARLNEPVNPEKPGQAAEKSGP